MIRELNHIGLFVQDMGKSLTFYRDALGGTVTFQGVRAAGPNEIAYLRFGSGLVELISGPAPDPSWGDRGLHHVGFISDDLDADYSRLAGAGATSWRPPTPAGTGGGRVAFLLDPNGVRVELLERERKPQAEDSNPPARTVLDHFSITAANHDSAMSFYGDAMGMETLPLGTGTNVTHQVSYLATGPDVLEIHSYTPPRSGPAIGHIAFCVADVPEALNALARHGIGAAPGYPRPARGNSGSIALIHDPDGNDVELLDRHRLRGSTPPAATFATDEPSAAVTVGP
jgi:catechol 2,3-dioxygenase-like lactoylglutathione lyase family enzyme